MRRRVDTGVWWVSLQWLGVRVSSRPKYFCPGVHVYNRLFFWVRAEWMPRMLAKYRIVWSPLAVLLKVEHGSFGDRGVVKWCCWLCVSALFTIPQCWVLCWTKLPCNCISVNADHSSCSVEQVIKYFPLFCFCSIVWSKTRRLADASQYFNALVCLPSLEADK